MLSPVLSQRRNSFAGSLSPYLKPGTFPQLQKFPRQTGPACKSYLIPSRLAGPRRTPGSGVFVCCFHKNWSKNWAHYNNNWNKNWNNRAYVRNWNRRPYYGEFVGGVVLGSILATTGVGIVPYAPQPDLCWYWADPYMYRGYWDYC